MKRARRVAERLGAPVRNLGAYTVTMPREQIAELDRGGRISALMPSAVGARGAPHMPLLLEQVAEARGCGWLPSPLGVAVSDRGGLDVALLGKQATEPERSVGVATLIGATVGRFCFPEITLFLMEHTQRCGGRRLAPFIGTNIGSLGGLRLALLSE